jgi:hypothetical protein
MLLVPKNDGKLLGECSLLSPLSSFLVFSYFPSFNMIRFGILASDYVLSLFYVSLV